MSLLQIPNSSLKSGPISDLLKPFGICNFHQAIEWVWKLPYGRNSDRTNYLLIPTEKKGTCSTKHAFIAAIAKEQETPLFLNVGIYLMNEQNTPGVGTVLSSFNLKELPEAHCYLKYLDERFDFTFYKNNEDYSSKIAFQFEEEISPQQIDDFKNNLHKTFLAKWTEEFHIKKSLNELWLIREECISALSMKPVEP